jgi:hypothetical protein
LFVPTFNFIYSFFFPLLKIGPGDYDGGIAALLHCAGRPFGSAAGAALRALHHDGPVITEENGEE